jgi:hypothetical protein
MTDTTALIAAAQAEVRSLKARVAELESILERDRSRVAVGLMAIRKAVARRHWLTVGRGSYAWDDDRWKGEFAQALQEIEEALPPLAKVAADWSNCPTDPAIIAAARVGIWEPPDG